MFTVICFLCGIRLSNNSRLFCGCGIVIDVVNVVKAIVTIIVIGTNILVRDWSARPAISA